MALGKLNQVLAVFTGSKVRSHEVHTKAYEAAKKPVLFNGFSKVYNPKDEKGETFPPEAQRVQFTVPSLVARVEKELSAFYDIALTRDAANCSAVADIVLSDGTLIAKAVPATHILFLEKHITELHNFVSALPVLDPAENWRWDEGADLFKSDVVKTARPKKVQKAIVLYDATDKHPAQTQLITEDETIGHWDTTKMSGAIKPGDKQALVERVEELLAALHRAREAANLIDAPDQRIGKAIFDYVLDRTAAAKQA